MRWKGYEPKDDTWEPIENLANCEEFIKDFNDRCEAEEKAAVEKQGEIIVEKRKEETRLALERALKEDKEQST